MLCSCVCDGKVVFVFFLIAVVIGSGDRSGFAKDDNGIGNFSNEDG